jgi:hypothetical protein
MRESSTPTRNGKSSFMPPKCPLSTTGVPFLARMSIAWRRNGKTRSRSSNPKDGGLRAVVPPLFAAALAGGCLSGFGSPSRASHPLPITGESVRFYCLVVQGSSGSSGVLIRSLVPTGLAPFPRSLVADGEGPCPLPRLLCLVCTVTAHYVRWLPPGAQRFVRHPVGSEATRGISSPQ